MFQFCNGLFQIADGRISDPGVDESIAFTCKTGSAMVGRLEGEGRGLVDGGDYASQGVLRTGPVDVILYFIC